VVFSARFFCCRRQLRNLENLTLVARRREHFRVFFGHFLCSSTPSKRGILVHKTSLASLASCQRYRHSVESRALTCPFKQSNLSAWSLLSWQPTHTYLWGRLCFVQVCCLLPNITVTPSDSSYVNRGAPLKCFSWIILTTNKLVNRIRNFESDSSQNDYEEDFLRKLCAVIFDKIEMIFLRK